MSGTLYGVGVGPGDPELLTLKAHRLISSAQVVAYPAPDDGDSFARSIVSELIGSEAEEYAIVIPMKAERFPAKKVYDEASRHLAEKLRAGEDVVVLCEGDPFFYGSFMYLYERLAAEFPSEIVPGVSSIMSCAAVLKRPIAARNDTLTVIPGPLPEEDLRRRLENADAAAIIKLGRHLPKVRRILEDLGATGRAGYGERASLPHQIVLTLSEAPEKAPYFSMILVYMGAEEWLT